MDPLAVAGPDWLASCRRIERELREMLAAHATSASRSVALGRGEGGDRTLVIDSEAERYIFAELARVHAGGHDFTAISEERGEVRFGDGDAQLRVVIDPIDGSINAETAARAAHRPSRSPTARRWPT